MNFRGRDEIEQEKQKYLEKINENTEMEKAAERKILRQKEIYDQYMMKRC